MAKGVNKVIIIGSLGKEPDTKTFAGGGSVCNISVATSERWKDKATGQMQEETEWHRVVMFNKLAEIADRYLVKGSKVYIEGKLKTRKWTDSAGVDRYSTEIVASEMQMLGGESSKGVSANEPSQNSRGAGVSNNTSQQDAPPDFEDDIPF